MPDPIPGPRPIPNKGSAEDRLQSWKEIAAYLGRDVRSVYRWEKTEHLPVHRLKHGKHGSVHAFKSELDAWIAERTASPRSVEHRREWVAWSAVIAGLAALVLWGWMMQRSAPHAARPDSAVALPFSSSPGMEIQPKLSPDGSQVAFAWNGDDGANLDIYVKLTAGGTPLRLTQDPADDYSPAWSADGAFIAFLRRRDAERVAALIAPALGGSERVVAELATGARIDWSRPGPFLTWSRNGDALILGGHLKENSPDRLLRISAATGAAVPITTPPAGIYGDGAPALSPDGATLAFIRRVSWGTADLCLLPVTEDLKPSGELRVVKTGSRWNASPAWTPDGKWVIFSTGSMDAPHLARVPAFGDGEAARLVGFGEHGWQPTVANTREGKVRVVFVQHFESVNIWRCPLDQPGPASELITSARRSYEPHYAPDGSRIAFLSDRSGYAEVWVAKSDGTEPQQWTSLKQPSLGAPRWSPDGRRIAFTAPGPQGSSSVYWIDAPSAGPRLVPDSYPSGYLAWGPDGRSIFFTSNRGGRTNIWKALPDGSGSSQVITRDSGRVPGVSPDGRHLFFLKLVSPDGSNDLFRTSIAGTDEQHMLAFVDAYSVCKAGIAYKYYRPGRDPEGPEIRFYSFTTGETTHIAETVRPLRYGVAASPDCRYLLYSQTDFDVSDLMLVEDFK